MVHATAAKDESATQETTASEEGTLIHLLDGVVAGSEVKTLGMRPVTEDGRPAGAGMKGKITASWANGQKKGTFPDNDTLQGLTKLKVRLPALPGESGSSLQVCFEA